MPDEVVDAAARGAPAHRSPSSSPVEGRPAREGDVAVVDIVSDDGRAARLRRRARRRAARRRDRGRRSAACSSARPTRSRWELGDGSTRGATVTLKELYEKVLPPLDDELARAASEFDTLDELRADIEGKIREQLEEEVEGRVPRGGRRRARQGVEGRAGRPRRRGAHARAAERLHPQASRRAASTSAAYLQATGVTRRRRSSSGSATRRAQSVARELVLEAVVDKLGIEVTDDDIRERAARAGRERRGHRGVHRGRRRRPRARRPPAEEGRRPDRRRGQADLAEELRRRTREESIWTPGKEERAAAAEKKLWTPGSRASRRSDR